MGEKEAIDFTRVDPLDGFYVEYIHSSWNGIFLNVYST